MQGKAEEMAKEALKINPGSVEAKEILKKILRSEKGGASEDVMRSIQSILSMVQGEGMEPVREILREAQELAKQERFEEVKEKLKESKELMKKYMDERAMKNAIIEDLLEIAQESNETVPEDLESMDLDDLRLLRGNLIRKIKRKGSEEKTKENLLQSLKKIRGDLENSGMLDTEMEKSVDEAKNLIEKGEFSMALEALLSMSAKIERERVEEMRKFLIEDTRELLQDADMEEPYNLHDMSLDEVKELRRKAINSLMKKGKGGGGLKEMVSALSGGAPMGAGGVGIKDAIINDIQELSELSSIELPENMEDMDLDSLKSLRKELIEKIKSSKKEEKKEEKIEYRGLGQVLLEIGKEDELMSDDIREDEYLANARGIAYFEKENYNEAVAQFKRALAINPNFKEAEFNLGYTLYILGNEKEGLLHLKKVGMEKIVKKKNLNP